MKPLSSFPEIPSREGLSRRDWIARLVQSAVIPLMIPTVAGAQEHIHAASTDASTTAGPWRPQSLSADANQTLVALGERIIPGSADAKCNQVIDLVLAIEPEKTRAELLGALTAFDREAQSRHNKAFRDLAPAEQDAILTIACEPPSPLHPHFQVIKEWMADTYWSSKQGMHELGWNGRMVWPEFPNCPEHAQGQA